ncbi:TolC family protein [uncultured Draconibacterium sp.]|uniref:TolC family protein n=1 Tax=uncultured Draconibacterium sp. TaxID=1573823 RepID=UPI0025E97389|nr:TolC family protein [uncultured Draconibacterium sp.]
MVKLSATCLLFFFFLIADAYGQNELLTIEQAVSKAVEHNAELNQLRARLLQKENEWRINTGIAAPEISYFKEGISDDPTAPFAEKRVAITQEIDFPLTAVYRVKALKQEVQAQENVIRAKEKEVSARVKGKYIEVIYALYLQRSRQNQLNLAQNLYNAVYTKFETGMGNGIDLANAEIQLDEARNDLDQSEWILHQARYGLFNLIGLAIEEQKYSISFADTLYATDIDISQIQALAVQEEQPAYQASVNLLNASDFYLKEAKSNILPDVRFCLYKQDYGTGYDFNGFELGLSIPIWFPFEQKGKIQMAHAKKDELLWSQKEIQLNMKKEIEYAWHNYSVSRSIVTRYHSSMKERASSLQSMSLKAYQLGEIDLLELLNAQQIFLKSEQRYLTALRDYYLQLVALEQFINQELIY